MPVKLMVKDLDYAYAVARIRANERYMLSAADIESLITSESVGKAIAFLSSKKWFDISSDSSIKEICDDAREKLWNLLSESVPDKSELEVFTVQNDYFNMKAALKSSFSENSCFDSFVYPTSLNTEKLKKMASGSDNSCISDEYKVAFNEAYEALNKTENGQLAEIILDKAALTYMLRKAEKSRCKLVKEYVEFFVATSNIKIAIKCIFTKKGSLFAEKAMVECSSLDIKKLITVCDEDNKSLIAYLKKIDYKKAADILTESTALFEKWIDETIVDLVKKSRYEFFGFAPVCGYYYSMLAEIKTVKTILSCKESGFSEDLIRERVGKLNV